MGGRIKFKTNFLWLFRYNIHILFIYCAFLILIPNSIYSQNLDDKESIIANYLPLLPEGACSYKIDLDKIGTLWGCNFYDYPLENFAKLILERYSGTTEVIYTFDNHIIKDLFRADLNNDKANEIIVVLQNSKGGDLVPYIFSEKENFQCIYPLSINTHNNSSNYTYGLTVPVIPVSGCKIGLANFESTTCLMVSNIIDFFNLGPPYLILNTYYKLIDRNLEKVYEKFGEINHDYQYINRATYAYNKGLYSEALNFYEKLDVKKLPSSIQPEYLFLCAESRRFIKEYVSAERLYNSIIKNFPSSDSSKKAKYLLKLFEYKSLVPDLFTKYNEINYMANQGNIVQAINEIEQVIIDINKNNKNFIYNVIRYFFITLKIEVLIRYGKIKEAFAIIDEYFNKNNISLRAKEENYKNEKITQVIPLEIVEYVNFLSSSIHSKLDGKSF